MCLNVVDDFILNLLLFTLLQAQCKQIKYKNNLNPKFIIIYKKNRVDKKQFSVFPKRTK